MRWKDTLLLRNQTRHIRMHVKDGPNRGALWSLATSRRFLTGNFERGRVEAVAALLQPGDCFWDVGAHFGYMTLLASRHIGNTGFIYAFEPSERNRWYLEHHIQWNNLQRQVTVFPLAISDADDERDFHNRGSGTGRLAANAEEADIRITVRSIDSLVAAGECLPPTFLKVDIEGAEADLLRGAEKTLRGADACIVLATHSPELHKECAAILKDYGYAVHDPDRLQKALTEGWNSVKIEPEILAVGPGRTVSEADILAFQRCE